MTEIKLAEHAGFCFGVREALQKAEKTIETYRDGSRKLYSMGPLIHNKTVTGELEKNGLIIIEDLAQAEKGSVIVIRSHGETEAFFEKAALQELIVVDTTCPFVSKIHKIVKEATSRGRNIVVVGDQNHPETIGIKGWAGENCLVIDSLAKAKEIDFDHITLVSQTTMEGSMWDEIEEWLKNNKEDVISYRTICSATRMRQKSCRELALESDLMVIVGDKKSSNTKKLYEIAKEHCEKVIFIEKPSDLPLKQIEICDRIGVAAGASTPERIIKEVIAAMSELFTENKEIQETEAQDMIEMQDAELQDTVVEAPSTPEAEVEVAKTQKNEAIQEEDASEEEEKNMMHDFMDQIDKALKLPNRGEIVDGEIVQVTNREIVVNLGYKKDGIIPKDELILEGDQELTDLYKEGDTIQAKVIKTDDGDGNILLSKKKLEVNGHWDEINDALDNKLIVNAKVIKEVKGGVIALYKEVSGFIPMSQLSDHFVEKADEFIGKILPVKVSRVDQKRNKAVFSHKAYLSDEKQKKVKEIWDSMKVGDIVEGTVMRFTDYGAFVDIGGIDGLLHISEISWGKLKHPQEALKIGEKITVKILSMNTEKGKISLGLKQNQPEPWAIIDEKFSVGQVIEGKVVQIKEYGAFVELEPGLDGLVHISEIAHKRVTNIAEELSLGQTVQAKILEIDKDRKRISLSIKETVEPSIYEEKDASPSKTLAETVMEKAQEIAEKVTENVMEKAEELKEKLEDAAEGIGDKIEDLVEDAAEKVEDLAKKVKEKTED